MRDLLDDLRFGLRCWNRARGFAITVSVTLAIAIGASVATFSLADAVILAPPPVLGPGRVLEVTTTSPEGRTLLPNSPAVLRDLKASGVFSSIAAATPCRTVDLEFATGASAVLGQGVTAAYFSTLGVRPFAGRFFSRGDGHAAVLSYRLFVSQFSADPSAIGSTIKVNSDDYRIIGVAPAYFRLQTAPAEIWTLLVPSASEAQETARQSLYILGRVERGLSAAAAKSQVGLLGQRILRRNGQGKGWRLVALTISEYRARFAGSTWLIDMLLGMAGAVLIVACAHAAGLLVCRFDDRRHEMALRAALGARPQRIIRQVVAEASWLGLAGGAMGLALGTLGMRLVAAGMSWTAYSRAINFRLDVRVISFAIFCGLASVVLFAAAPSYAASRAEPSRALAGGSPRVVGGKLSALQLAMVYVATALSVALLAWFSLVGRFTFTRLTRPLGFDASRIELFDITLPAGSNGPALATYFNQLLARIQALPGVSSAAWVDSAPPGHFQSVKFGTAGKGVLGSTMRYIVSPGYFETLGVKLVLGRRFREADSATSPRVAIVNQALAKRVSPEEPAIDEYISIWDGGRVMTYTIIGVVGNLRDNVGENIVPPQVYFPIAQHPEREMTLVVRRRYGARVDYKAVASAIWAAEQGPRTLIGPEETPSDVVERTYGGAGRFLAVSIGLFTALAISLATLGVYAALMALLGRLRKEMALRSAFGAGRNELLRRALGKALLLTWPGLALGALGALAILRSSPLIIGSPLSTGIQGLICLAIVVLVGLCALAASILPALSASRVDPAKELRN